MSEEFTLEDRILCEDDTCIGLIGPDGKCKVCGRIYEGAAPLPHKKEKDAELPEKVDLSSGDEISKDTLSQMEPLDEEERILCPDDTCIGIIGPDGKCGTCGKSA
jgi:hypothetical protein